MGMGFGSGEPRRSPSPKDNPARHPPEHEVDTWRPITDVARGPLVPPAKNWGDWEAPVFVRRKVDLSDSAAGVKENIEDSEMPEAVSPDADARKVDRPEAEQPETPSPETDSPEVELSQADAYDGESLQDDQLDPEQPEGRPPTRGRAEAELSQADAYDSESLQADRPYAQQRETQRLEPRRVPGDRPGAKARQTESAQAIRPDANQSQPQRLEPSQAQASSLHIEAPGPEARTLESLPAAEDVPETEPPLRWPDGRPASAPELLEELRKALDRPGTPAAEQAKLRELFDYFRSFITADGPVYEATEPVAVDGQRALGPQVDEKEATNRSTAGHECADGAGTGLEDGQRSTAPRPSQAVSSAAPAETPKTVEGAEAVEVQSVGRPPDSQEPNTSTVERAGWLEPLDHERRREEWYRLEDHLVRPAIKHSELRDVIKRLDNRPAIGGNLLCEELSTVSNAMESIVDLLEHPGEWLAEHVGVPRVIGKLIDLVYGLVKPLVLPLAQKVHLLAEGLRVVGAVVCTHDVGDCPCARALLADFAEMVVRQQLAALQEAYWNGEVGPGRPDAAAAA